MEIPNRTGSKGDAGRATLRHDIPLTPEPTAPFIQALARAPLPEELLPIDQYAAERSVPRELVWSQIQSGRLRVRVKNGVIYILHQVDEHAADAEVQVEPVAIAPPMMANENLGMNSLDLRALLEHLTAAKAEQRELAQLTRTTIEQIRSMSAELVSFKDKMLAEKDEKISNLEQRLEHLSQEAQKLRQSHEDLETLLRAIDQ